MPGIGENHTHRSRGSLSRTRCEDRTLSKIAVSSDVLRPTGMPTTDEDIDTCEDKTAVQQITVRSDVLRPTGIPTTDEDEV